MRPRLLIISDTALYRTESGIYAFGPVVNEMESVASLFSEITWIGFNRPDRVGDKSMKKIETDSISVVMLPFVGGKGLFSVFRVLIGYPRMLWKIVQYIRTNDVVHMRGPSHPTLIGTMVSFFYRHKIWWNKYAGSWVDPAPLSYHFQRWLYKKATHALITVNGEWPNQEAHVHNFENPCLSKNDRDRGRKVMESKTFTVPFTVCFVGRLEDAKGVQRILDALKLVSNKSMIKEIHLVGDGPKAEMYQKQAAALDIPIHFHGFLGREEVFEIYRKSDVFLLPSDSEGFPKVVAEAMNFGCIPIVSAVSSIGQYVMPTNGYLIRPLDSETLAQQIEEFIVSDVETKKKQSFEGWKTAENFTFEHYRERIRREIMN